jgi:hypothetical protein
VFERIFFFLVSLPPGSLCKNGLGTVAITAVRRGCHPLRRRAEVAIARSTSPNAGRATAAPTRRAVDHGSPSVAERPSTPGAA